MVGMLKSGVFTYGLLALISNICQQFIFGNDAAMFTANMTAVITDARLTEQIGLGNADMWENFKAIGSFLVGLYLQARFPNWFAAENPHPPSARSVKMDALRYIFAVYAVIRFWPFVSTVFDTDNVHSLCWSMQLAWMLMSFWFWCKDVNWRTIDICFSGAQYFAHSCFDHLRSHIILGDKSRYANDSLIEADLSYYMYFYSLFIFCYMFWTVWKVMWMFNQSVMMWPRQIPAMCKSFVFVAVVFITFTQIMRVNEKATWTLDVGGRVKDVSCVMLTYSVPAPKCLTELDSTTNSLTLQVYRDIWSISNSTLNELEQPAIKEILRQKCMDRLCVYQQTFAMDIICGGLWAILLSNCDFWVSSSAISASESVTLFSMLVFTLQYFQGKVYYHDCEPNSFEVVFVIVFFAVEYYVQKLPVHDDNAMQELDDNANPTTTLSRADILAEIYKEDSHLKSLRASHRIDSQS